MTETEKSVNDEQTVDDAVLDGSAESGADEAAEKNADTTEDSVKSAGEAVEGDMADDGA